MDAIKNPNVSGAGTLPPEPAGPDDPVKASMLTFERVRNGYPDKNRLIIGSRGVGKTVLLNKIHQGAEALGLMSLLLESCEDQPLPGLLIPALYDALHRMNQQEHARAEAKRALGVLAGFADMRKLRHEGLELSCDAEDEHYIAGSGSLEYDLEELLCAVGEAVQSCNSALVLLIDEMQIMADAELDALIMALHRMVQRGLPVTLVGAGLPQLITLVGAAKPYAERMFSVTDLGPKSAAKDAVAIR